MLKNNKIFVFLILISCLLYMVKLVIQTNLGVRSQEYTVIRNEIKEIDAKNSSLKQELYTKEALTRINEEARSQGFVDVSRYYIVK